MTHWSEQYVGREYKAGEYDCVHLVVDVRQSVFGEDLTVDYERKRSLVEQTDQIHAYMDEYIEPIAEHEAKEGDVLLMRCRGRLTHTGVICEINNVKYVLHNLRNIGCVAMHRIRDVNKYGCEPHSYYTWKNNNNDTQRSN